MHDQFLTTYVHPALLKPDDLVLSDPDFPDRPVRWEITATGREYDVVTADYITEDGGDGRHGFELPHRWLLVAVPLHSPVGAVAWGASRSPGSTGIFTIIKPVGGPPIAEVAQVCARPGCGERYVLPLPSLSYDPPPSGPRVAELAEWARAAGWSEHPLLGLACPLHPTPLAALPPAAQDAADEQPGEAGAGEAA